MNFWGHALADVVFLPRALLKQSAKMKLGADTFDAMEQNDDQRCEELYLEARYGCVCLFARCGLFAPKLESIAVSQSRH